MIKRVMDMVRRSMSRQKPHFPNRKKGGRVVRTYVDCRTGVVTSVSRVRH